jgi:hypothetical protein
VATLAAAELKGVEMSSDATTITSLYERIPLEAMQQVANSYMAWYVEKATRELDETIARLRTELEENDKQEALFKPSASELESMRRLQSNKVNDVALLDRLVERGEDWLVLTMQRLDYFERAGLAPNDYPGWCEHALSGAYDWIDGSRLQASKRMFSLQGGATGPMRAVRPADLAAINVTRPDAAGSQRSEAAPAQAKPALAAQPTRPEPAASRPAPATRTPPAPAARAPEVVETSTQPVPAIAQPAPAATTPTVPEQIFKAETAPLPPPAQRPEPPRQPAPTAQAPQRPPAQATSPVADAPTRPTPIPTPAQEASSHQRLTPAASSSAPAAPPAPKSAPATSNAPTAAPSQRPQPAQQAAHAPVAQAPQRPQPAPPAAAQQGPTPQQPYGAPPKPRPSGANWNYQNQQADPRYSLEDVEVEDLEEEGDDQGLLRKIFRVFTG